MHPLRNVRPLVNRTCELVAPALFFQQTSTAQGPSLPPPTLIKASRLLDPRTGNVLSPAAVLVADGRIKQVGSPSQVRAPAAGNIIDLGNATLLPGLIDGHTHLLLDIIVPPEAEIRPHPNGEFAPGLLLAITESPSKRTLMGAQLAREDLESGITTVRNLGHSGILGFRCQYFRKPNQCLARHVAGQVRKRQTTIHDIDNPSAMPRNHSRQYGVSRQNRASQVHIEDAPPLFNIGLPQRTNWSDRASLVPAHLRRRDRPTRGASRSICGRVGVRTRRRSFGKISIRSRRFG
jgi:hypothetical protein